MIFILVNTRIHHPNTLTFAPRQNLTKYANDYQIKYQVQQG